MAETASRVAPIVGLALHLGRGVQRVATDAAIGRLRSIPRAIASLITAGMGGTQAEGIALEGLRRSVAALGDLDTVALLEKSLCDAGTTITKTRRLRP